MFNNPEVRNWLSVVLGALVACAAALADSFYFKAWGSNADLVIFMAGLGALGLHITATVSANAVVKGINSNTGG